MSEETNLFRRALIEALMRLDSELEVYMYTVPDAAFIKDKKEVHVLYACSVTGLSRGQWLDIKQDQILTDLLEAENAALVVDMASDVDSSLSWKLFFLEKEDVEYVQ